MAASSKKKQWPTVRLWLLNKKRKVFWRVRVSRGKNIIRVPVPLELLEGAEIGFPWSCWLAGAIQKHWNEHPEDFPHKMEHPYVTTSQAYLIDKMQNGVTPTHCYQYVHDFGPYIKRFDPAKTPEQRAALIESLRGETIVATLTKARKRRPGQTHQRSGAKVRRSMILSRGALRRAEVAGLVPPRTGKMTQDELFV